MYCKHTPELDTTLVAYMTKHVVLVEGLTTGKADVNHPVEVGFIIGERLSMRHVMLWWRVLMGSGCACMYVWMCVIDLQLKYHGVR